jgi:trimeric autotransporter adhesin
MAFFATFLDKTYTASYATPKVSVVRTITVGSALDTTFGIGGTSNLPDIIDPASVTFDIVVDSQGRALISSKNTAQDFINVVRLNSNGTVDNTFGINGSLEIPTLSATLPPVSLVSDIEMSFDGVSTPIGGQTALSFSETRVLVLGDTSPNLLLSGENAIDGTGTTADNTIVGNSSSNKIYGLEGNDILNGAEGKDTLFGGAGNDTLFGGTEADTMIGGLGDDIYYVDNTGDIVLEDVASGTDTVKASISYTLTANVENLTLIGAAVIDGTGNALANTIIGNSGVNILRGGAGTDTLYGGAGNDILDGGVGIDTMYGGVGNDTYIVDDIGDVVTEDAGEGTDLVTASVSYTIADADVENLTLIGSAANATGNASNNILTGNGSSNRLDGVGGEDTMRGGAGNDAYVVNSSGDLVEELASAGIDTVESSFENLTLTGTAITGTGNILANTITGNASDNTLNGGLGNDILNGGLGIDTLNGDAGNDTLNGGEGGDTLNGGADNDILNGGADNDILNGDAGNDTLNGDAGNDTLNGGLGSNTLKGGAGNDTYIVASTTDIVTELADVAARAAVPASLGVAARPAVAEFIGGTDTVEASISYTLTANVENLILTGSAANGTGNALANTITGNGGNNTLNGGLGKDTMIGGLGDDTYVVSKNVGVGNDDIVTESAGEGTDTIKADFDYILTAANIENLTLTGSGNFSATGNDEANIITGNTGNNTLNGGLGVDILIGGKGNDTYIVDSASETVTELANEGKDTIKADFTYDLSGIANVENLTLTGTAAINGTGNTLDNIITGNTGDNTLNGNEGKDVLDGGAGNDILDGGLGADTMKGGLGGDIYIVDNIGDIVIELVDQGVDLVESSITYTLGANVENLNLTGAAAINGTGNALNNFMVGNSASNTLNGGLGNDNLFGEAGDDTLDGGAGNDTLNGGADNDNIKGGLGNDTLNGGTGNDTLDGGFGNDTMAGGEGDDIYIVDVAGDTVTEAAGEGTDLVKSSVTYILGTDVENLTLTGAIAINGTGNDLNNSIIGNNGSNTLNGGVGNDELNGGLGIDTMNGGVGNDTYTVDNIADVVFEAFNQGTDTVESSVTYTLTPEVENLKLTGTGNINGTGNILANILTGNTGNNILRGGEGNDILNGDAGNDTLNGGMGNDTLDGGTGNDTYVFNTAVSLGLDTIIETATSNDTIQFVGSTGASIDLSNTTTAQNIYNSGINTLVLTVMSIENVTGGDGSDTILGNADANILIGGLGNDTLTGGAGNDTLTGGAGNDSFVFNSTIAFGGIDTISDFAVRADKIKLDATIFGLTAGVALATDAVKIVATDLAGGASSGSIVYNSVTGGLFYNADGATAGFGGTGGQFATLRAGLTTLSSVDFLAIA